MGSLSLLPLSITTNCTMKSLLIFSTLLAVGLSEPEAKAIVAPYNYGIPGYYGGVEAPFAYNNAWTAPLNCPSNRLPLCPSNRLFLCPLCPSLCTCRCTCTCCTCQLCCLCSCTSI